MRAREAAKRRAESQVLETLKARGGSPTALELARELGWPWQIVAQALHKLALRHEVRTEVTERKDDRYRVRRVVRYRVCGGPVAAMPEWLCPRVVEVKYARRVICRARGDQGKEGPE